MSKRRVTPKQTDDTWTAILALRDRCGDPLPVPALEAFQAEVHGQPLPYVRFLYHLAAWLKPDLAVELGTEWGVTSAHLCAATPEGHVVGVDEQESRFLKARPDLFRNYVFLHLNSLAAGSYVEALTTMYGKIGLLFQDTRLETQGEEWAIYAPLMAPGGVWVADDIDDNAVWDALTLERKFRLPNLHEPGITMGIAIL